MMNSQPSNRRLALAALAASALLFCLQTAAACGGPSHRPIITALADRPRLPSRVWIGDRWIEARFNLNHAQVLGQDLARKAGVIPIAVRIGQRVGAGEEPRAQEKILNPILFLEDGTALRPVQAGDLEENDERIASEALDLFSAADHSDSLAGYLFFSARASAVRLKGRFALLSTPHINRELDLARSLLSVDLQTTKGKRRVWMGLALTPFGPE